MSIAKKRRYNSSRRVAAGEETRASILRAAKTLFGKKGLDKVTIAEIAAKAGIAGSTVYSLFKSKEGILRALFQGALFGDAYRAAQARFEGIVDPVKLIALTPEVSRAIYESESAELGLLRGASGFSPALRKIEQEFEKLRYDMQEARLRLLFDRKLAKKDLHFDEARRILWMYTSREVYRMLVQEGGWSPQRYQKWLEAVLLGELVENA